MSITLNKFLKKSGYNSIKLVFLETKHYSLEAKMTHTKISESNAIQIGKWEDKIKLITFDMSHINTALGEKKVDPIDGIVGADVLKKSKAILDYKSNKLYLKL